MRIADALRAATDRLTATSDTARLDAELLMAHALGCSRSDLLLRHQADDAPEDFAALVERRGRHEPIAYILGTQEFHGLDLAVRPGVLIPRGDSEAVVGAALAVRPEARSVLDLGTGSGALLLALLSELPAARGTGVDAAPVAVETARANAAALDLGDRASFVQADWHDEDWSRCLAPADLLVCNPPYVEDAAALDPDVRAYEPGAALFAGPEGLDDYRALIPQLDGLLAREGVAVFEIGHTQAEPVGAIARENGFAAELARDLAARPRALILRRNA